MPLKFRGLALVVSLAALAGLGAGAPGAAGAAPAVSLLTWSYPEPIGPSSYGGEASGLTAISCAAASQCALADADGTVLVSSTPTRGLTAWRTLPVAEGARLVGIACPRSTLCVAASSDGRVFTSTDAFAASGSSGSGGRGPGAGGPGAGGPGAGGSGPPAVSWTSVQLPGMGLITGIACSPSGFCAVIDDAGEVSTSPQPGAGSPVWTTAHIDPASRSCSPTSRCQAGLTSISCPTQGLCLAFDTAGNLLRSTTPGGGASAWQSLPVDSRGYQSSVSHPHCPAGLCVLLACPASTSCIAVDTNGNVITSSSPAGAQTDWVSRPLSTAAPPTAIACQTASTCELTDGAGQVILTANPNGGQSAFSAVQAEPLSGGAPPAPTGIACPTSSSCLLTDAAGNLLVATPPASPARIAALVRAVLRPPGAAAHLRALLADHGYTASFDAPQAGTLRLTWDLFTPRSKRRAAAQTLIASERTLVLGPGPATASVGLDRAARRALAHLRRATIEAVVTFTSSTGTLVRRSARLTLGR